MAGNLLFNKVILQKTQMFDQKQKSLQRSLEDAQSDFQAQQNEIVNRIGGKMMDVLDKYAKTNAYALILDVSSQTSPVLWAGACSDFMTIWL